MIAADEKESSNPKEIRTNEETRNADARPDVRFRYRGRDVRPGHPQEGRYQEDQEEGWQEEGRRPQEGRRHALTRCFQSQFAGEPRSAKRACAAFQFFPTPCSYPQPSVPSVSESRFSGVIVFG